MQNNNTGLPQEVFDIVVELENGVHEGITYTHIFESEMVDEGKYQHQTIYYKKDDVYFGLPVTKSGSYFSEYYFQYGKPYVVDLNIVLADFLSLTEIEHLIKLILSGNGALGFISFKQSELFS